MKVISLKFEFKYFLESIILIFLKHNILKNVYVFYNIRFVSFKNKKNFIFFECEIFFKINDGDLFYLLLLVSILKKNNFFYFLNIKRVYWVI